MRYRLRNGADAWRMLVIFGVIPTATAMGAILAHTTHLPGRRLRKGVVLQAADVAALLQAGYATILAARLEAGDLGEDEAAGLLADALLAPGLALSLPGTGRANIVALTAGLFRANRTGVDAINAVDDSITLATLADASPVQAGEMVATIKIIPFAAPRLAIERASGLAKAAPMRLAPFHGLVAGLVLTTLPGLKQSVLDRTAATMRARIERLTGTMLPPAQCAHAAPPIAGALRDLLSRGAGLLLIAGASAVADRQDVAPGGIVLAGGEILHFGMPVDPGNLLCLGRVGDVPALVLPGCARSPALNGIDLVLARLFAGESAGPAAIRRMGLGGLVKEFAGRPSPRKLRELRGESQGFKPAK